MKQMFFFELKQNVTKDFFKKYLYGEKVNKVFSLNTVADRSRQRLRISIQDKQQFCYEK